MKNNKIFVGLLLSLLLIISGCTTGGTSPDTATSAKDYEYEITIEDKVAEYDKLWDFIENDLAAYVEYGETQGIDLSNIKAEYREKVESSTNFEEYVEVLEEMMEEVNYLGDLNLVDEDKFFSQKAMYEYMNENSLDDSWTEVMEAPFNNELSVKRYTDLGGVENPYEMSIDPSVDLKEFDEKTVMFIDYKDFDGIYRDKNIDLIVSRLNRDPFETVIIDVSGSHGENSELWIDLIECLIDEPVEITVDQVFTGENSVAFAEENIDNLGGEIITSDDEKVVAKITRTFEPNTEVTNRPETIYIVQGDSRGAASELVAFGRDLGWTTIGEEVGNGQGIYSYYTMENSGLLIGCRISTPSDEEGNIIDLTIEPEKELELDLEENPYRRYNTLNSSGVLSK